MVKIFDIAATMANNDYISIYRQFFEEFAKTTHVQDCMPVRVTPYNLSIDELAGEVMLSCVNYLIERKCPRSLVVPITVIVVEEFINEAKKQPEEVSTPLELNKRTLYKISEVCLRYTDNEKLSSLPGPIKETYYSTHSTKHTRRRMEDRLICLPRFNTLHRIEGSSEAGYYGIFDGHSGVTAACYAVSHLHQFLAESEFYPVDPVEAFHQAFEKTELKYNLKDENCGTAALAILHQHLEKKLTVAWVGDSQAMLVNEDSYVLLVDPHKPERMDERKRIEELGGCLINIESIFRVNGLLAISRAIGDKKLKPYISAEPEIRVVNLAGSEHFIVMGCDGLWDVVEPHQVIETVYFEVKKHEGQIDSVARRLVDLAKENNSTDNISVIVIFLTDPAEIINLSIDVTGHRPKILQQDGAIMEANFQTEEKSALGDPGMNGIYETNGNHFDIQNASDEDFGPETDVDAVDDVLTSSKTLSPFSKEVWQKTGEEKSEKLIEFRRSEDKDFGDELVKFSEDLAELKPVDDNNSNQTNDRKSDKFPVDNINPFDTPIDFSCDFTQDNNKYTDEINSRKEGADMSVPNFGGQLFELKNKVNLSDESQSKSLSHELCGFDSSPAAACPEPTVPCTEPAQNATLFFNEDVISKTEENMKEPTVESLVQKDSDTAFSTEFDPRDTNSNEKSESQPIKINESMNLTSGTTDRAMDLIEQKTANTSGNPFELCSVTDIVEAARVSQNLCQMEGNENQKDINETSSELFSPNAPVLDGEAKDEIVGESGGEVEDSEDDEWNYIKVESGSHQNIPTDTKANNLVFSPNESSSVEVPTMNSPLNPEADEFIPVSAKTNDHEFNFNMTPKKAIPGDLTDIISSSPNWNNMNNVSVPEEAAFLNEIKSRPSNIFENVESPQEESSGEKMVDLNNSFNLITTGGNIGKENEFVPLAFEKPHGIELASDMTSSFIDPSTIGSEEAEMPEENLCMNASPVEKVVVEKEEFVLNESAVKDAKESGDAEISSKLPDLLSPESIQEDIVADVIADVKQTESEPLAPSFSEPVISLPLLTTEEKPVDTAQIISPSSNDQPFSPTHLEIVEKSVTEKKPDEALSPKVAEAQVSGGLETETSADTSPGIDAAKKVTKKPATKTPSTPTSKASVTSKTLVNGSKAFAPAKKPTSMQTSRTSASGKTPVATTTGSAVKATTAKVSAVSKTQSKPTAASSTTTKTTPRPRLTPAASAAAKTPSSSKATVTTSPVKSTATSLKSAAKTSASAPPAVASKPKPRVPSASAEKKTTASLNGDAKSSLKRTEVITKRITGSSTTTTTTTTTTAARVSSSARPAAAPLKPTTVKSTVTTTRTVTAKPRTTVSSTTTSTPLSPAMKTSTTARKSTIGAEKQAKEVANRLTSKTGLASKATGVVQGSTAATMKTRKTLTTTLTSKTKNHDKTETKAENILEVEVIKSENGAPLIENKTDINLINSITSEQVA